MAVVIVIFALALVSIVAWQFRRLPPQLMDIAAIEGTMVFYGKVVDHRGEPVTGARIDYITTSVWQDFIGGHTSAATRADDRLTEAAMEDRKKEGYF